MFTTEATYHVAANGVPARCYESSHSSRGYSSMDEAFGLDREESFDLVF